ncbi:MAG: cytidine deaminase [Bacteroidetes bacterium]|nr:cytidine deaminase [Bacteroidota bacterium]
MPQFSFSFERCPVAQLPAEIQMLIQAAETARATAYAPYSHFKVGAAILLSDGTTLRAANQENASFPAGICAERAALAKHNLNGSETILALAISYLPHSGTGNQPLSPCGICRQSILEAQLHQGRPIAVYMCSPAGEVLYVKDASLLLPFHFSSAFL